MYTVSVMPRSSVAVKQVDLAHVANKKVTSEKAGLQAAKTTKSTAKKKASRQTVKKTAPAKNSKKSETASVSVATTIQAAKKIQRTALIKRNPLGHLLIEKLLREAGFRGGISCKKELLDAYSTDESIFSIRPQVILQPKTRRDVEVAATVVASETKRFTSLSHTARSRHRTKRWLSHRLYCY